MAAEFHRKTAALFEEFKKKELHFLNTEVNYNRNVNLKNNLNSPFQEYLQKINKREQETEKSYKDLMRQMEELGKRTDEMTLKLEKLNALRNVGLSSNVSAFSYTDETYDRPLQTYYSNSLLQTTPKMLSSGPLISDFPPRIQADLSSINYSFPHSTSKPNYYSVTTQTEYIFCDNCHFPLILNSEMPASNSNLPSRTTNRVITNENERNPSQKSARIEENFAFSRGATITKSAVENRSLISKSNFNFSGSQLNDHDGSMFMNEGNDRGQLAGVAEISLKEQEVINEQVEKRMSKGFNDNAVISEKTVEPFQKRMSKSYTDNADNEELVQEPFQKRMSYSYTDNELTNVPIQKRLSVSYTDNTDTGEFATEPFQKRMSKGSIDNEIPDELTNAPAQKRLSESFIDNAVTGDFVTHTEEKQYVEIQDNDLLSNDGNFEQTISRSDEESMRHEFDFLESDKSKIPKTQLLHQTSGDTSNQHIEGVTHNERYEDNQLQASYAIQADPNHSLKVQQLSRSGKKIEEVSSKDLSFSAAPPSPSAHSENTSVISESDSFSEKETPLTATAAYQALLGNVNVVKPKQKSVPVSDSDSEDEIENALANAVRRTSHIVFDSGVLEPKTEKRKESIAEIKTEKNTKPVDSASSNRPQKKLSKNTLKVLGLDTSSEEEEKKVTSPTSKIEEESDEFDFYD